MKCPKCGYENKEGTEHCDLCKEVLIKKTSRLHDKLIPFMYHLINGIILIGAVSFILRRLGLFFLSCVLLVVAIPVVCIMELMDRKRMVKYSKRMATYLKVSRIVLTFGWIFCFMPAMWTISLFIAEQPWLISLKQGPDTEYAREGFRKQSVFSPPSSVSRIYYYEYGLRDTIYYLRFQCSDPQIIDRFIASKPWRPFKEDTVDMSHVKLEIIYNKHVNKWWREGVDDTQQNIKRYSDKNHFTTIYYNPITETVWVVGHY